MGIAGRMQWALAVGSSSQARPSKRQAPGRAIAFPFPSPPSLLNMVRSEMLK